MAATLLKWLSDDTFVLAIDKAVTEQGLLGAAGIAPGGYGAELAERLLRCVFGGLVDLRDEYASFYSKEYGSFQDFLIMRYHLPDHDARMFQAAMEAQMMIAYGETRCGGDHSTAAWVQWAGGRKLLHIMLGCAGGLDESSE